MMKNKMMKHRYSYEIKHSVVDAIDLEPTEDDDTMPAGLIIVFSLHPTIYWADGEVTEEEPIVLYMYPTGQQDIDSSDVTPEQLEENIMTIMQVMGVGEMAEQSMDTYERTLEEAVLEESEDE